MKNFDFIEIANVILEISPTISFDFFYEVFNEGKIVKCKKHTILYEEDSFNDDFYVILRGYVRSFKNYNKGKRTTYIFQKKQIVLNVYSVILDQPSAVGMECITDCILFKIDYKKLEKKILASTEAPKIVIDYIFKYTLDLFDHLDQLTLLTNENRYEWLENNRKDFLRDLPDKYVAAFLGISTASFSRIKKKYDKS
ncbi:hypothetical protein UJ101_02585 [Flavobacteriaceae bacterium UJ101]|nr:hypothetical protein UJ101_02585 [Flavobacteriaceae bacterium UJ101]